jgi:hypothetical protein
MTGTSKDLCVRILYAPSRFWKRVRRALTELARERYRPERHYMRGPGPKHRAQCIDRNAGKFGTTVTTGVNDTSKGE